ncbi:hypothetical protein B0H13DRAFT_1972322, partial [Mycena leptocephala]
MPTGQHIKSSPFPAPLPCAPRRGAMAQASPMDTPSTTHGHGSLTWLVREFVIIVAFSFLCLLAILQAVQYHVRLFLTETVTPPCTEHALCSSSPCAQIALHLAALSPLDVLEITTTCAALVFIGMEVSARILLCMGWVPVPSRADDAEAGVVDGEACEIWTERKPRPDVLELQV